MSKQNISLIATTFSLITALLFVRTADAATPTVLALEHIDSGQTVVENVKAERGTTSSASAGKEYRKWAIRPGDKLESDTPPKETFIDFYRGTDKQRVLLFTVDVRYFRDSNGLWVPRYQLNEQVYVVRDGKGRWQPITSTPSVAPIMLTGRLLPNAAGFYQSLEFSSTGGLLRIDSWTVR